MSRGTRNTPTVQPRRGDTIERRFTLFWERLPLLKLPGPEGRHHRATFHAAFAGDTTTVSPFQGFQMSLSDSPTAHAVSYDLPPSGLKTETLRILSSEETDFCRNGRPLFSDLPETPDDLVATTATRRELGAA